MFCDQRLQDVSAVDRSEGRPKAIDKYMEELIWSQIVHSKWVTKVQYIDELESAVSCSLDGLLWIMDVERRCESSGISGPNLLGLAASVICLLSSDSCCIACQSGPQCVIRHGFAELTNCRHVHGKGHNYTVQRRENFRNLSVIQD
jgi:hypothetical protein